VPEMFQVSENIDTNQDNYRYRQPENETI